MSASKARLLRFALFAAVYFAEGAMMTYLSAFNTLYMRSFNLSFTLIGIVAGIAMLPFILKVLIGLLSDKVDLFHKGHRKPYIIIGLIIQSVCFLLLPMFKPDTDTALYVTVMTLMCLGMSTYDTTTDGFSIDSTAQEDRGIVQGLMVGGRALAVVITGYLMGVFSGAGHWDYIFYMSSLLGLIALAFAFIVEEKREHPAEKEFSSAAFVSFKNPSLLLFILMGFVYPLALYGTEALASPFAKEALGASLSMVGLYTGVYGIGTVVGGIIGGPLMRKLGQRSSLFIALVITTLVTIMFAITPSAGMMWVSMFLFGLCFGYYSTVYFALAMEFADPRIAAFMFAVIMAVGNLAIAISSAIGGKLVDSFGFRTVFGICAVIHILVLPIIFGIFKLREKRMVAATVPATD